MAISTEFKESHGFPVRDSLKECIEAGKEAIRLGREVARPGREKTSERQHARDKLHMDP